MSLRNTLFSLYNHGLAVHQGYPPVQDSGQIRVMSDDHGGETPFTIEFQDKFLHPGPAFGVQVAGGFVRQQGLRFQDQGPGHRHPLLFAPGEGGDPVRQAVFQPTRTRMASACSRATPWG